MEHQFVSTSNFFRPENQTNSEASVMPFELDKHGVNCNDLKSRIGKVVTSVRNTHYEICW